MKDLKIKVNNEAESKEAQELLFELGASWNYGKEVNENMPHDRAIILHTYGTQLFWAHVYESKNYDDAKEITLAELRSMVKPMKEYLNTETCEYKLAHTRPDGDWVCIPEGADKYIYFEDYDNANFYKGDFNAVWQDDGYWDYDMDDYKNYCKKFGIVLWKRDQDEPFLTPECTLNNQYAEIEQVRQAIKVKSGSDSDHALDAMSFGIMGAGAAQAIGGVDATLAERQSTYGNFEDVAFVTENIMSVLGQVRVNGLSELPNTHRMALYMIASKMARIVNGDFNHLDGWHDIGGYAKLVEDLIKENNNG